MKRLLLILIILIVNKECISQSSFSKSYDNDSLLDYGMTVIQTLDNGYLLGGNTYDPFIGWNASLLIKTDCTGDTIWRKVYDLSSTGSDGVKSLIQKDNGNYIVFGSYQDTLLLRGDMFLMELNIYGDILWFNTFGEEENENGYILQRTLDKGYILCGYTDSDISNGGNDMYIVKTDSLGNEVWTKNYGGVNSDNAYSIDVTDDGGYIIGGISYSYSIGEDDLYMLKIDSIGNFEWDKTFGTTGDDYGETVIQTMDGGYAFVGCVEITNGNFDAYFVKTDNEGNVEWEETYGTPDYFEGFKLVKQLPDSSFIVSGGLANNSPGNFDGWVVKMTSNGDTIWTKTYGNPGYELGDYFYGFDITSDGGFVFGGQDNRIGPPYQNAWLVKTDSLGCYHSFCDFGCDSCAFINAEIFFTNDTILLSSPTVQFIDTSDFATQWFWDFGDSSSDTVKDPVHTFTNSGIFDVMLVSFYSDCTDTAYMTITVFNDLGVFNEEKDLVQIFPNPTENKFVIQGITDLQKIEIFSISGIEVYSFEKQDNEVDVSKLGNGIYVLRIFTNESIISKKLIINKN